MFIVMMNTSFIKKVILSGIFLMHINNFTLSAQSIDSIFITPKNPNELDTVYIMVKGIYSSSSCDSTLSNFSIVNKTIYANTTHCTGMLPSICVATDTFKIPPLSIGSYSFIVNVNQGFLPACTPGIAPGPTDSIGFTVSSFNKTKAYPNISNFDVYPTLTSGTVFLNISSELENTQFLIYSISGQAVYKTKIANKKTSLNLDLKPGIYFCQIKNKTTFSPLKKLIVFANK